MRGDLRKGICGRGDEGIDEGGEELKQGDVGGRRNVGGF